MDLWTEWITFPSSAGAVPAYAARPRAVSAALPGIIVIQEVWGVDDHIQDLTQRFATAGYLAIAPDLYAHDGRRPEPLAAPRVRMAKEVLDAAPPNVWTDPAARNAAVQSLPAAERAHALETMSILLSSNRPIAQYVGDVAAAAAYTRTRADCTGRVGSAGYCMGGMLAALLAARDPELGAAAIYYGSSPDPATMQSVRAPMIGFYGAQDTRITSGVPTFADAMRAAGKAFEYHIYPGAPHAFFNDTRPAYRIDAARDAWARTLMFFDHHLAGAGD